MVKRNLIAKLNQYKQICNDAIEKSRSAKIDGAINWADLKCFEVKYAISSDGTDCYQFFIEEADPSNREFHDFIEDEIFVYADITSINIFTEW